MTQRSQQRWNTGKRGAEQKRMERFGSFWASRRYEEHEKQFGSREALVKMQRSAQAYFPHSPNLCASVLRGIKRWVESQPVEF